MSNSNAKTLKGIRMNVVLEGRGGVNYDNEEQKKTLEDHCGKDKSKNDNETYLKKSFFKKDGTPEPITYMEYGEKKVKYHDMDYFLKISQACLRHEIFGGTSDADSIIWKFPTAACNFIASPLGYMRGYMSANKEDSFGKKSCLNVTDAIDKTAAITSEFFSKSGDRNGNSVYKKETVGDTRYEFSAYFDVKAAQFMSVDEYFGRRSVSNSYIEGSNPFEQAFKAKYGRIPYTKGIYTSKSDIFGDTYGEVGFKFDDEFVNGLIREAVKRLLSINIVRVTGEAHTAKVEITPIYDGCPNEDDTMAVTLDDVDSLNFNIHQFYTESSQHDWEDRAKAIEENKKAEAEKKKAEAENKKSSKKK